MLPLFPKSKKYKKKQKREAAAGEEKQYAHIFGIKTQAFHFTTQ